jgi:hypothetical protein
MQPMSNGLHQPLGHKTGSQKSKDDENHWKNFELIPKSCTQQLENEPPKRNAALALANLLDMVRAPSPPTLTHVPLVSLDLIYP